MLLFVTGAARAEGKVAQRDADPVYHPMYGLVIPGAVLFGVSYLGALSWSITGLNSPACPGDRWMALPLAGPFITSSKYGEAQSVLGCDDSDGAIRPLATLDGVGQVSGAVLMLVGFTAPLTQPASAARSSQAKNWPVARLTLGSRGGAVIVAGAF